MGLIIIYQMRSDEINNISDGINNNISDGINNNIPNGINNNISDRINYDLILSIIINNIILDET